MNNCQQHTGLYELKNSSVFFLFTTEMNSSNFLKNIIKPLMPLT